ncbi:hypothetical protein WICPIJ_004736 [Wickerhamomyces pijperi]|uniref:NAD-dependent epimerase/dehydratase domain-containing protein n=1 Tax=Wickerhamomyces pijperi TaxID=599730 RepID=A0A9P8Q5A6_WICPI|nr:hypothetical protein WICPIJ_004736 [Wickerhamomyces pijperi]
MSQAKTVFLTGASGFIALHITNQLLSRGYHVIGTVRSQSKADNIINNFKAIYPDVESKLSFEIVPDISEPTAFDSALQAHPEIQFVLHTASPFSFGLDKGLDEGYLIPATQGTKNILTAVKKYAPQVTNVVVTSSFASIMNFAAHGDSSFVHTEETWNPMEREHATDEITAYIISKKLAEKVAWEFVETEKPNFKLTTVTPPYVLGPQMFEDSLANKTLNTSAEIVNSLLSLPADYSEQVKEPLGTSVDVRDVALLHILPLENPQLAGQRLFPTQANFIGQSILNIIHKEFPELDGKVGKGQPEGAEEYAVKAGLHCDTSKTLQRTGIKAWIPLETTVKDSVAQILHYKKEHPEQA